MHFLVDPEKCTECGRCTIVCSIVKEGRIQPLKARIMIERRWPDVPKIAVCRFEDCDGHPCVASCPFDAISVVDGKIFISEEECTGCEICVDRCQFGAISIVDNTSQVDQKRCVGCGLCVTSCSSGARTLVRKPEDQISSTPRNTEEWMRERAENRGIPLEEIL